jgi:hypothetical protein
MAKQLSYKRSTSEQISIKGSMNAEATEITYLNEDKEEVTIAVQTLLDKFASQGVSLTIKTQTDEELELDEE